MNRETYLKKASEQLQKIVFAPVGLEIPNDVKISCGFAPSGNKGKRFKTLGVCHNRNFYIPCNRQRYTGFRCFVS